MPSAIYAQPNGYRGDFSATVRLCILSGRDGPRQHVPGPNGRAHRTRRSYGPEGVFSGVGAIGGRSVQLWYSQMVQSRFDQSAFALVAMAIDYKTHNLTLLPRHSRMSFLRNACEANSCLRQFGLPYHRVRNYIPLHDPWRSSRLL